VSDGRLRDLERLARQGDHTALAQLERASRRAGSSWPTRRSAIEAEHALCDCPGFGDVKPTIPEVAPQFEDYLDRHPGWGAFHVILEDYNTEDHFVESALDDARRAGDAEVERLARLLLRMSRSQRRRLGSFVDHWHRVCWSSGHQEAQWYRWSQEWRCPRCTARVKPVPGATPPPDTPLQWPVPEANRGTYRFVGYEDGGFWSRSTTANPRCPSNPLPLLATS
jgi:hypothetical protein